MSIDLSVGTGMPAEGSGRARRWERTVRSPAPSKEDGSIVLCLPLFERTSPLFPEGCLVVPCIWTSSFCLSCAFLRGGVWMPSIPFGNYIS